MSESRVSRRLTWGIALVIGLVQVPLAAQSSAPAAGAAQPRAARPSVAELHARRIEFERIASARADSMKRLEDDYQALFTDSLVAGGRTVRFIPGRLNTEELDALRDGLESAEATLRDQFGDDLTLFRDTIRWRASVDISNRYGGRGLSVRTGQQWATSDPSWRLWQFGVRASAIEAIALNVAGRNFVENVPTFYKFTGGAFTLNHRPERLANAGRELALSWATVGRECAAGSPSACRAVLTVAPQDERLSLYFTPADYRAVVTSGELSRDADSTLFASKRRCLAGADTACARVVKQLVRVPDPFSGGLRATMIEHALRMGGTEGITRMRALPRSTPALQRATALSGVSEDSLLRSWQHTLRQSVAASVPSPAPVGLATLGWAAIILLAVTRRRP